MNSKNYKDILVAQTRRDSRAKIIKCHIDEAMGMSLATGIPIICEKRLYDCVAINCVLEQSMQKSSSKNINKLLLHGPYFDDKTATEAYARGVPRKRKAVQDNKDSKREEITDADTFFSYKLHRKRAYLRSCGVKCPRPREGQLKVDALIFNILDVEVAYEILRRLAETNGDYVAAALMEDNESRKPDLARAHSEAVAARNIELAKQLSEQMNNLSLLKYDPTNPDEAEMFEHYSDDDFSGYNFDVEDWYFKQRKIMYNIVA